MRSLFGVAVFGCLLAGACSSTSATAPGASPDASAPEASDGCEGAPPQVACPGCCGSTYQAQALCVNGSWSCPSDGVICLCAEAPTPCSGTPPVVCDGCCGSKYPAGGCLNGEWTCIPSKVACTLCDAGTDAAGDDASVAGAVDGEGAPFLTVLNFGANTECLPTQLAANGSTGTTCRILLTGVVGGCQLPGLSPAGSGDVAKIDAKYLAADASAPPASMVCEATQLPAAATAGAGCADQAASGWCYVQGSCPVDAGQHCQQDICTTPAFDSQHVVYGGAWLACP